MAFQRFTRTGTRGYTPKASIWSRGQIGFNQGAAKKLKLGDYEYAILFYDADTRKIGINFTNDESEEGATKLSKRVAGGASISAKAFLDFYGIEHPETKKYDIDFDEDNKLYVIQLE
jgi:hypothetical protein